MTTKLPLSFSPSRTNFPSSTFKSNHDMSLNDSQWLSYPIAVNDFVVNYELSYD